MYLSETDSAFFSARLPIFIPTFCVGLNVQVTCIDRVPMMNNVRVMVAFATG